MFFLITEIYFLSLSMKYYTNRKNKSERPKTKPTYLDIFWSPWFILSICFVPVVVSPGILYIGRDSSQPRPHTLEAAIVITIICSVSFLVSLAAIIDMIVLCYIVPKQFDSRLNLEMLFLIPLSRIISWSGIFFCMWGWNPASWNGISGTNPYDVFVRILSHTTSVIVIYDANTTLVHAFSGIFAYELYLIVVPVLLATSVTLVLEHTKIGEHNSNQ
jgi:hypothetical protein